MSRSSNRNRRVVKESAEALYQMKMEIAAELGLIGQHMQLDNSEFASELGTVSAGSNGRESWGHMTTRDVGSVGGAMTRRLIQKAQETLMQ